MTGSKARRENNVNLDFPRLAGQSGPVPGPMGLHKAHPRGESLGRSGGSFDVRRPHVGARGN